MRNLKKILALVLALMMTLSMMVTANAASTYSDADQVDGKYDEAVDVLTGLGVFRGTDASANTFNPKGTITRAEVAALVYRIISGDTNDTQNGIYSDYNKFSDVINSSWYAGYVNYAANGQYIVGDGQGHFYPTSNVTGYEVLAIMLRAIGYGKNGEFEGAGWQIRVATLAKELHITDTVETTLGSAFTREVVAELLFRAITKTPTVTYTPALGYNQNNSIAGQSKNPNLGVKTFGLRRNQVASVDIWGRPGYTWFKNATTATTTYNNEGAVDPSTSVVGGSKTVATINLTPDATFTVAATECDIASAIHLDGTKTFNVYINGGAAAQYDVQAADTTSKLGGQGVLLEVYNYAVDDGTNSYPVIVHIDTFLARVESVSNARLDAAGHLIDESSITLKVFDTATNDANSTAGTTVVLKNGSTNYTYAKNDMVLVNVRTTNTASGNVNVLPTIGNVTAVTGQLGSQVGKSGEIQGLASTVTGNQTIISVNSNRHTVNGTVYNDNAQFKLDEAKQSGGTFTWYLDNYGNLIGSSYIVSEKTYATIESIRWNTNTSSAEATLVYMDGTTGSVVVKSIDGADLELYSSTASNSSYKDKLVCDDAKYNYWDGTASDVGFTGRHLYKVNVLTDGKVELVHVANAAGADNELTGVNTASGTGTLSGIDTTGNAGSVLVNNNTIFLVKTGNGSDAKYNRYTTTSSLGQYTEATVDYVDANGDGIAEYVYIIAGTTATTTTSALMWITDSSYSYPAGNNPTYTIAEGYVDGVKTTNIQTKDKTIVDAIAAAGNFALYYVTQQDGMIITADQVTIADFNGDLNTLLSTLTGGTVDVKAFENHSGYGRAATATGTFKLDGVYFTDSVNSANHFQVTSNTKIVDGNTGTVYTGQTEAANAGNAGDLTGYNVYVIYRVDSTNSNVKDAVTIYYCK